MANKIETGSKNIKPWINLNHNTYISAILFEKTKRELSCDGCVGLKEAIERL